MMSGTHGDLFREIGALVVAAHAGETIDLTLKSAELAETYQPLRISAETISRMIARSVGAVGVSLEIIRPSIPPLAAAIPAEGESDLALMAKPNKRNPRRGHRSAGLRRA
jgi:hypothetical protein